MKTLSITAALSFFELISCSQQAARMNKQWKTGPGKFDGLYGTPGKKYIYSDWNSSIYLSGSQMPKPEVLLNTSAQKINAADFGIIRSQKLILVPTFSYNKVVCYSLPDIRQLC